MTKRHSTCIDIEMSTCCKTVSGTKAEWKKKLVSWINAVMQVFNSYTKASVKEDQLLSSTDNANGVTMTSLLFLVLQTSVKNVN